MLLVLVGIYLWCKKDANFWCGLVCILEGISQHG